MIALAIVLGLAVAVALLGAAWWGGVAALRDWHRDDQGHW